MWCLWSDFWYTDVVNAIVVPSQFLAPKLACPADTMRRVRKFLVLKVNDGFVPSPPKVSPELRSQSAAVQIEGWHSTWTAAINLLKSEQLGDVAIVDGDGSGTVIAYFSRRNLEQEYTSQFGDAQSADRIVQDDGADHVAQANRAVPLAPTRTAKSVKLKTKFSSANIREIPGYRCNMNCSDYAWDWVGGAEREVPFRLKYFERQAVANPEGVVSRARALVQEIRDWAFGHVKKIG